MNSLKELSETLKPGDKLWNQTWMKDIEATILSVTEGELTMQVNVNDWVDKFDLNERKSQYKNWVKI